MSGLPAEQGVDEPPTHPSLVREGLGNYHPPSGKLLLAECDGQPGGRGCAPNAPDRGRGGESACTSRRTGEIDTWDPRSSIGCLIKRAELGATTVLLDTCRFMTEAQQLYRSRGFVERPPYEGTEIPPRLQDHVDLLRARARLGQAAQLIRGGLRSFPGSP